MSRLFWLAGNAALTGVTFLVYAATSAPKVIVVEHPVARPILVLPAGQVKSSLVPRRRATLDDVRRDWKIEGRLDCNATDRPGAAREWRPLDTTLH